MKNDGRAEPGVDGQRHDVADREVARAEDRRRQHRVAARGARSRRTPAARRARRCSGAQTCGSDQPSSGCWMSAYVGPARPATHSTAPGTSMRWPPAPGIDGTARADQPQAGEHERHVHREDHAPGEHVDEQPAERRPDRDRRARAGRPRADRRRPLPGAEDRGDDRQRARHEQRAERALQRARADQQLDRRRDRADERRGAEARGADREDPPPAVEVAERAADEDRATRAAAGRPRRPTAGRPARRRGPRAARAARR